MVIFPSCGLVIGLHTQGPSGPLWLYFHHVAMSLDYIHKAPQVLYSYISIRWPCHWITYTRPIRSSMVIFPSGGLVIGLHTQGPSGPLWLYFHQVALSLDYIHKAPQVLYGYISIRWPCHWITYTRPLRSSMVIFPSGGLVIGLHTQGPSGPLWLYFHQVAMSLDYIHKAPQVLYGYISIRWPCHWITYTRPLRSPMVIFPSGGNYKTACVCTHFNYFFRPHGTRLWIFDKFQQDLAHQKEKHWTWSITRRNTRPGSPQGGTQDLAHHKTWLTTRRNTRPCSPQDLAHHKEEYKTLLTTRPGSPQGGIQDLAHHKTWLTTRRNTRPCSPQDLAHHKEEYKTLLTTRPGSPQGGIQDLAHHKTWLTTRRNTRHGSLQGGTLDLAHHKTWLTTRRNTRPCSPQDLAHHKEEYKTLLTTRPGSPQGGIQDLAHHKTWLTTRRNTRPCSPQDLAHHKEEYKTLLTTRPGSPQGGIQDLAHHKTWLTTRRNTRHGSLQGGTLDLAHHKTWLTTRRNTRPCSPQDLAHHKEEYKTWLITRRNTRPVPWHITRRNTRPGPSQGGTLDLSHHKE